MSEKDKIDFETRSDENVKETVKEASKNTDKPQVKKKRKKKKVSGETEKISIEKKKVSVEKDKVSDKKKKSSNEQKKSSDEKRKPSNEQKKPSNEKRKSSNEKKKSPDTKKEIQKTDDFYNVEEIATEEEKKPGKAKKILKRIALVLVGLVVLVYAGISVYFMSHFYPNTVLNGVDVSQYTVEQVEAIQEEEAENYILRVLESDNDITIVYGSSISVVYERDGKVNELLKSQNPFLWITSLWQTPVIDEPVSVSYDAEMLSKYVDAMDCMKEEEQTAPVSAHPEVQGDKFVVVDEQVGTQIDRDKFMEALDDAISRFSPDLDLVEADCYVHAKYNIDSPEIAKVCEEMNTYLGAEITLDFTPYTEVVDASVIGSWIHYDENMTVTFSEDDVRAYIQSLADKYDTYGKPRQFVTGYGNTVEVTGGSYGWQINQEEEFNTLLANVQNKEVITREPVYSNRGVTHEGNDFGTTYAEVDLTNQHMFYFKDGQLMMESDIVTGNPNAGNATPQGVYSLAYKQRNVNLRGPKKEDGTYEWDSPVSYWMPFNGGIGFHDAIWQSAFGGTRYTWAGSHGCVNMPYDKAGQLYELIETGTPVICHY